MLTNEHFIFAADGSLERDLEIDFAATAYDARDATFDFSRTGFDWIMKSYENELYRTPGQGLFASLSSDTLSFKPLDCNRQQRLFQVGASIALAAFDESTLARDTQHQVMAQLDQQPTTYVDWDVMRLPVHMTPQFAVLYQRNVLMRNHPELQSLFPTLTRSLGNHFSEPAFSNAVLAGVVFGLDAVHAGFTTPVDEEFPSTTNAQ